MEMTLRLMVRHRLSIRRSLSPKQADAGLIGNADGGTRDPLALSEAGVNGSRLPNVAGCATVRGPRQRPSSVAATGRQ
jgi:hypothetical protein